MLTLFVTLLTIAAVAIGIVSVTAVVLRVSEAAKKLRDPARLQQVFAETAAAALRRAGADPRAIAKLDVLRTGGSGEHGAADLRTALEQARAALRKPGAPAPISARPPAVSETPSSLFDETPRPRPSASPRAAHAHALHRAPRPRPQRMPLAPLGGFESGDHFRLSEPPDISEPHAPLLFNANWLALAALVGAVAYYLMR